MSDVFAPAMAALSALAGREGPAVAAVDGRCGSGKTTLARRAAEAFGCPVVHMDDFYLPMERRIPAWRRVPGANMDLARLEREVLTPFLAGGPAVYRPYDCGAGCFGPAVTLSPGGLLLVEGSYCLHPALAGAYALKIFLTCSPEEQARRLRAREGERFAAFQQTWIPLEEAYHAQYRVADGALCIDTGASA